MRDAAGISKPSLYRLPNQTGKMAFSTGIDPLVLCWSDIDGGYDWDAAKGEWVNAFTPATIPEAYWPQTLPGASRGVWAMAKCANINRYYAIYADQFWRRNGGIGTVWTWVASVDTMLGQSGFHLNSNEQGGGGFARVIMGKMAVDDLDPNIIYIGPSVGKPRVTRDAGATWADVPGTATATGGTFLAERWSLIAIDRSSAAAANGGRSIVAITTQGRGLYRSTDGCATPLTLLDAGRNNTPYLAYNPNTNELWGINANLNANNVFKWTPGGGFVASVCERQMTTLCFIAGNANLVAGLSYGTEINRSTNSGAAFEFFQGGEQMAANEGRSPLVAQVNEAILLGGGGLVAGNMVHSPADNSIYLSAGYDVERWSIPQFAAALRDNGRAAGVKRYFGSFGQSGLVSGGGGSWAPGCDPIVLFQDAKALVLPRDGSQSRRELPTGGLGWGTGADWALDNPLWQAIAASFNGGNTCCGFTTDGGKTGQPFPTQPYAAISGFSIAVSTVGTAVVAGGSNFWPKFTIDGGVTWNDCVFAGITRIADGQENGFGYGLFYVRRFIVRSDKSTPGKYYIYNYGPGAVPALRGIWVTTNYGANWTNVNNGTTAGTIGVDYHTSLKMPVAGNIGALTAPNHLYMSHGVQSDGQNNASYCRPYRNLTGGAGAWTQLPNCGLVFCYDFGAPDTLNGFTYPTLWYYGYGTNALYPTMTLGFWKSHNPEGACDLHFMGLAGELSEVFTVLADPVEYAQLVIGYSGHGANRFDASGRAVLG